MRVTTDQFSLSQNMTADGVFNIGAPGACFELKWAIQSKDFENVTVRS